MPQLDRPPVGSPGRDAFANTATGGSVVAPFVSTKERDRREQQRKENLAKQRADRAAAAANTGSGSGSSGSGSSGSGAPAATGLTAAEKKAARDKKIADQKAANAAAKANKFNPLLGAYKSPAELRKEAADLAALSVATEDSLRSQQALQESGLTGLSTALGNRLGGLNTEYQATLSGLGNAYGQTAANTAAATNEQLIASGAPSSVAPVGANPALGNTIALLGAVPSQYATTAAATGTQLVGASRAALQKSLTDRANTVSANTAKYLQALRETEYNKAVANVTAEQNAARLGVDSQYKAGMLGVAQSRAETAAEANVIKRESNAIKAQIAAAGGTGAKAIKAAQKGLLGSADTYVRGFTSASGDNTYNVTLKPRNPTGDIKVVPIVAASPEEARTKAAGLYGTGGAGGPGSDVADVVLDRANTSTIAPTPQEVIARTIGLLTIAGMSPKAARSWIIQNIILPYGVK
jgi:hypothetical protein